MHALHEVVVADEFGDPCGHARHESHAEQHVVGVGQLDAVLGERRAERSHAERQHVHHTAGHASRPSFLHALVGVLRRNPLAQAALGSGSRTRHGRELLGGAHVSLAFDAGNVARICAADVTATERENRVAVRVYGKKKYILWMYNVLCNILTRHICKHYIFIYILYVLYIYCLYIVYIFYI